MSVQTTLTNLHAYPEFRRMVNEREVPFQEILSTFSFIKNEKNLIAHFECITQCSTQNMQEKLQEKYSDIIVNCKKRSDTQEAVPNDLDVEFLLKKVGNYFQEDHKVIIQHKMNRDDLTVEFASIVILDLDPPVFEIYIKNNLVHEADNLFHAFKLFLMDLQVFNIQYPKNASRILEFFTSFFFKIYPSVGDGSKSRVPKSQGVNRKVITLLKRVKN